MTQTLAYQIGAVFFLVVLVLAGTMTRGLFPVGMFKNVTLTLGVVAVLIGGYAAYRALPEMSSWFDFGPGEQTTEAAPASGGASAAKVQVKQTRAPRPVTKPTEVETPSAPLEHIAPSQPVDDPPPVVVRNAATDPEPEGKGKKALQSVGRFLHIGRKKDDGQ